MLSDQCRPVGPALPANRGRPVAGHRPIGARASVPPARVLLPPLPVCNNRRCRMFVSATRLSCRAPRRATFSLPSAFSVPTSVRLSPSAAAGPLALSPRRSPLLFSLLFPPFSSGGLFLRRRSTVLVFFSLRSVTPCVALLYGEQMLGPLRGALTLSPPLFATPRRLRPGPTTRHLYRRRCTCTIDS